MCNVKQEYHTCSKLQRIFMRSITFWWAEYLIILMSRVSNFVQNSIRSFDRKYCDLISRISNFEMDSKTLLVLKIIVMICGEESIAVWSIPSELWWFKGWRQSSGWVGPPIWGTRCHESYTQLEGQKLGQQLWSEVPESGGCEKANLLSNFS